jgi:hypothetical protein
MTISKLPPWAFTLIALAPALALLPFTKVVPSEAVLLWSGLAVFWSVAFSCLGWRRLDETGRAAHISAWVWGGSSALFAMLIVVGVMRTVPGASQALVDFIDGFSKKHPAGETGFIFGVLAAAMVQAVGYFLAWLLWWGRRRGA